MVEKFKEFEICSLTREIAAKYAEEILALIGKIPGSHYRLEDILAENKGDRVMYGKWEHSLIALAKGRIVGVLIGYERKKEKEGIYSINSLYINEIAVSHHGAGLGEYMLRLFVQKAQYLHLDGDVVVRIQTEKSEKNRKVIDLYKKVGFKEIGVKSYQTKDDLVMEIKTEK